MGSEMYGYVASLFKYELLEVSTYAENKDIHFDDFIANFAEIYDRLTKKGDVDVESLQFRELLTSELQKTKYWSAKRWSKPII